MWLTAGIGSSSLMGLGAASNDHARINAALSTSANIVLALGDSVPAGVACDCVPFPELYARQLTPSAAAINLAEGGYTSDDVQEQIERADTKAAIRRAGVIMLMVGANDVALAFDDSAVAATRVGRNVRASVARIRAIHGGDVQVLVFGYWNVVEDGDVGRADYTADRVNEAEAATRRTNDALRHAAEASDAVYVSTDVPFKGHDGAKDPTGLLAADGDHPNARGHQLIARAALAALPS